MDKLKKAEEDLTLEDICIHYYTGQSIFISGEGRNKVFCYRHGVETNVGNIQLDEWIRIARQLIDRYGEQTMFQQLVEWEKEHCPWVRSDSESEQKALEYHVSRMQDNPLWCDYIPFNRKYRPEVLLKADILQVQCVGCGNTFELTTERYKNICLCSSGKLYCDYCHGLMSIQHVSHCEEGHENRGELL